MKKSTIIIFLALAILKSQAQDYLINFAGAGATTEISTVKVDNLTSGATVTLNGGDILHLKAPLGIEMKDFENGILKMYPNPMKEQSILTFAAPENGNAVICIVDISGKTVSQISRLLSPGTHSFRVSGISQGLYFVKVTGKNYDYSAKLISQSNLQSEARIEYVSFDKNTTGNPLKSITATVDMPYTEGDQLLYKGISGIYSTIVTDIPTSSKTTTFTFVACTDSDGNHYATVRIGTGKSGVQTWMAENLRGTHYLNGEAIPNVTDNTAWSGLTAGAYCWYNNDEASYKIPYGALYNWYAVNDSRNLCSTGWHVPTDAEWTTLTTYLGGVSVAGGKLKETGTTHWLSPNTGATNETGFTALPGGYRFYDGAFNFIGSYGHWWSSTEGNIDSAWSRFIDYVYSSVDSYNWSKKIGVSVRCVRDN